MGGEGGEGMEGRRKIEEMWKEKSTRFLKTFGKGTEIRMYNVYKSLPFMQSLHTPISLPC